MLNNSPIKRAMRLSRFSQNCNPDIFKTLQLSFGKECFLEKDDQGSLNMMDSVTTSKRSIFQD